MKDRKYPLPGVQHFEMEVAGKALASSEAQLEYLQKVLKVNADRIADLELRLKTAHLSRSLEVIRVERQLEVLAGINADLRRRSQKAPAVEAWDLPKLPWWRRWARALIEALSW